MTGHIRWLAPFAALALAACDYEARIVGRLAFPDDVGCSSSVYSQNISWQDCHALKRRFDAQTGDPIRHNQGTSGALRPIPARMTITYRDVTNGERRRCGGGTYVVDRDGMFDIRLPKCGSGRAVEVVGVVELEAPAWHPGARSPIELGWIRAAWPLTEAATLFANDPDVSRIPHTFTSGEVTFATPTIIFKWAGMEPPRGGDGRTLVNVGTQVFTTRTGADTFGYLRQMLSGYTTIVALFDALEANTRNVPELFEKMLPLSADYEGQPTYAVRFDTTWAHATAGAAHLFVPDEAAKSHHLSETEVLAHEFGHSIHHALAGRWPYDDHFGVLMTRTNGTDYSWGHFFGQYGEIGFEFTEGVASGIGQYLMNQCGSWAGQPRPLGAVTPFVSNPWSADASCDAIESCGYHRVRYQLKQRGVKEDASATSDWSKRTGYLRALATTGQNLGTDRITTNDEGRLAEFTCDLLDSDSDVTHAAATSNQTYLPDFVQQVGEALDGREPVTRTARYPAVKPEEVRVTLTQLLRAMRDHCPDCDKLAGAPGADYNTQRLSATKSPIAPQSLLRKLIADGIVTKARAENLLQSNRMEHDL